MSVLIRARPTIQAVKQIASPPPETKNLIRKNMIRCSYSTFWDEFNLRHLWIEVKHLTVHYSKESRSLLRDSFSTQNQLHLVSHSHYTERSTTCLRWVSVNGTPVWCRPALCGMCHQIMFSAIWKNVLYDRKNKYGNNSTDKNINPAKNYTMSNTQKGS